MKLSKLKWKTIAGINLIILKGSPVFARDFAGAGTAYTTSAKTIAENVALGGVFVGAAMFAIPGVNRYASKMLMGGAMATFCVYAAPSLKALATAIFGG